MDNASSSRLLKTALLLGIITIGYNVIEGIVSVWFGLQDETLALFGFGIDSFVEVLSGAAIVHMVVRMQKSAVHARDQFERQALRITGWAFYLLAFGMVVGAAVTLLQQHHPETTLSGIMVSLISLASMWWLMQAKMKVGNALHSEAILADANCTKTCLMLSGLLLASSLLYELFHIAQVDAIGSIGIAWFAWSEGKEALEKARSGKLGCCCSGSCKG
uniref:Membrane protein, putative n=1 Tax=Chlorobium chlorochromatii (strain CaD3) TaxID=340177 RepID=Q3ASR2_CHLCH